MQASTRCDFGRLDATGVVGSGILGVVDMVLDMRCKMSLGAGVRETMAIKGPGSKAVCGC